jgi:hypothetical protein
LAGPRARFHGQIGGHRTADDAALSTLIDKDAGTSACQIAQVFALSNDSNETFAWLDRAWDHRDGGIRYLLNGPFIKRFASDPRFAALCHKVGLPAQGESTARESS